MSPSPPSVEMNRVMSKYDKIKIKDENVEINADELSNEIMIKYEILCIFLAGLLGLIMGLISSRGRVYQTFFIVALGSALVAVISTEFSKALGSNIVGDPGRLSAQVIAAMGFVGTGLIWTNDTGQTRGLSASASLWLTAIMGLLVGSGLKHISTLAAFVVLMIYWLSNVIIKKRTGMEDE